MYIRSGDSEYNRDIRINQTIRSVDNEINNRTKEMTLQLSSYNKLEHDVLFTSKRIFIIFYRILSWTERIKNL